MEEPISRPEELTAAPAGRRMRPLQIDDFRALYRPCGGVSLEQVLHLLEYSVLAPSTHNSVPQAYRIHPEYARVELCLRRQHVMPASDERGEQALISVGCALENLILAARAYAVVCRWRPAPELSWARLGHSFEPDVTQVASVEFAPGQFVQDERTPNQLLSSMIERRTIRAEFQDGQPLAAELRTRLAASCLESGARVRLDIFEAPAEKFAWGKLDEAATKHKLEESAFRQELGRSLLSNNDTESVRGMRGREFGLDDRTTRQLSAELRGDLAMPVDRLAFLARAGRHGLSCASSVCVLSSAEATPETALEAGMLLQRCWLAATASGFACAVHAAICEVAHLREMAQATLMPEGTVPLAIFRLGKLRHAGDWTRPHSSRPALRDLLLSPV